MEKIIYKSSEIAEIVSTDPIVKAVTNNLATRVQCEYCDESCNNFVGALVKTHAHCPVVIRALTSGLILSERESVFNSGRDFSSYPAGSPV